MEKAVLKLRNILILIVVRRFVLENFYLYTHTSGFFTTKYTAINRKNKKKAVGIYKPGLKQYVAEKGKKFPAMVR